MKTAALDLGSNSFLCLISELDAHGELKVLEDSSLITRLGQGVKKTGVFSKEALLRAAQAFSSFKNLIDKHGVTKVQAVATAAAREASNFKDLEALGLEYGIKIKVISGETEAELSFKGAISDKKLSDSLLLDIGGGSTEMAYFKEGPDLFLRSLPLGSVSLGEMFISDWSLLEEKDLLKMKEQILKTLKVSWKGEVPPFEKSWVAVAGTPTTLKAVLLGGYDDKKINESLLTLEDVQKVGAMLLSMPLSERRKVPGLQPKRADVIPVGAIILETFMEWAGIKQVQVSTRGLRYGLAQTIL